MAEVEYKIRTRVGNIYVWCGDCNKHIGKGYEVLCQFVAIVNDGRVSHANIDTWFLQVLRKPPCTETSAPR